MQLNNNEFEGEVNNLIEWCEDLDYEKYINNWHHLATSAYAGGNAGGTMGGDNNMHSIFNPTLSNGPYMMGEGQFQQELGGFDNGIIQSTLSDNHFM